MLAWAVAALRPTGPYPLLNLDGEQGSGKTTAAKMLREIIDPNECPVRSEPKEARDLSIAANNSLIIMYDNLSKIPPWLSDCLCRLATGGGFATRELYSDDEEKLFSAQRPALVNGIGNIVERPDLLDRTLPITLPTIPESKRRPESELWARFHAVRSRVLGALFDAVATAQRRLPLVKLTTLPRLADFAIWATAAEPALGLPPGAIMKAHTESREESTNVAIEASLVGMAVRTFIESTPAWCGTMSALLVELNAAADEKTQKGREKNPQWPKTGRGLGGELKRISPELRRVGINAVPPPKKDKTRTWFITRESGGTTAQTAHTAEKAPDDSARADSSRAVDKPQLPDRPVDRPTEIPQERIATAESGDAGDAGGQTPALSEREVIAL